MDRQLRAAMRASSTQKTRSSDLAPTGSKCGSGTSLKGEARLPAWPNIHSRPPQLRTKGCVLASVLGPHVALRTCKTKRDDSRCSHAFTSSPRMLPRGGDGSLSTEAEGSPAG